MSEVTATNLTDEQTMAAIMRFACTQDQAALGEYAAGLDHLTLEVVAGGFAWWHSRALARERERNGLSREEALAQLAAEYEEDILNLAARLATMEQAD
jgi:hypothetical protein